MTQRRGSQSPPKRSLAATTANTRARKETEAGNLPSASGAARGDEALPPGRDWATPTPLSKKGVGTMEDEDFTSFTL